MKILFIHQNFPGQFRHLAPCLARAGHDIRALTLSGLPAPEGVNVARYQLKRAPAKDAHPLLREIEAKVHRGEACASAMLALQRGGFQPDLVISNPAWGESLFVKDIWPQAKLVCLLEFFYAWEGGDVGFDPEFQRPTIESRLKLRMKNLNLLEALHSMDHGVSPTSWQASRFPSEFQAKLDVIFDGIDCPRLRPDAAARFVWPAAGLDLCAGQPVVSFVNRNLEPYRGYHVFMRALPRILRQCPQAQVVIVGGDGVSYGAPPPPGTQWKHHFLAEVEADLDMRRVHFVGALPYDALIKLFQVAAAHVYLTYPFVLSWSCLEAMSVACHVIGSRTAPVMDYIEDGVNGSLVDFFDTDALADAVCSALARPVGDAAEARLRHAARQTVIDRCDLNTVCLPRYRQLLGDLMGVPV
jgi:glycosyltransferase involved in cell wall biosynthesis